MKAKVTRSKQETLDFLKILEKARNHVEKTVGTGFVLQGNRLNDKEVLLHEIERVANYYLYLKGEIE